MAEIKIQTNEKRFPTAPDLYGLFFEDINRSADSGLYPEMLRNRTFEDSIVPDGCTLTEDGNYFITPTGWKGEFFHGEGKSSWIEENHTLPTDIPAWYADGAEMKLEYTNTLNLKRRAALDVSFEKGGKITNVGYCGISVETGKAYDLLLFAGTTGVPAFVTVSVESKDGAVVYAEKKLRMAKGYGKYECTFISAGTDADAVFVVRAEEACEILFGFSSLMPCDTYNGHGMRIDLMEKLAAMKPKFLRFPGGCIVEGATEETLMRFSKTVGPVWERPSHWNLWGYRTTNGLGFHEYLQICEDLDLEPLYVFNCGMTCQARNSAALSDDTIRDLIEEAKNALEYARGSVRTKWGALRAKMGHPEPFKMTYLEIGNENWGPEYWKRYEKCYRELKAEYPDIIFISNAHTETIDLPTEVVDEHFYSTPTFFAENMHRYDTYPRTGPKIFVGEFAVTAGNPAQLCAAVSEAMFMIGMEHNQDIVMLESFAPLFENVHFREWYPNMLVFDNHRSFCIPSYYAWKIFGSHRGQYVLESSYDSEAVYRKHSGGVSLYAEAGTKFRNAVFNGKPIAFTAKGLGGVSYDGVSFTMLPKTEGQEVVGKFNEDSRLKTEYETYAFLGCEAKGEQNASFSVEAFVEENKNLTIGMYFDGGDDDESVLMKCNGIRWHIENGKFRIREGIFGYGDYLTDEIDAPLNFGSYNKFAYEVTQAGGKLYINDAFVGEFKVPSYQKVTSVALDDGDDIIVKLVNFNEKDEDVCIDLDCDVKSGYKIHRMSGCAGDMNSFEDPEKIRDYCLEGEGASRHFVYHAPAYSVNVLTLTRTC